MGVVEGNGVNVPTPGCVVDDGTSDDGTRVETCKKTPDEKRGTKAFRSPVFPDVAQDPTRDVSQRSGTPTGEDPSQNQGFKILCQCLRNSEDNQCGE